MNKRDFIKYCILGFGGSACGLLRPENLFSSPDKIWKWSKEALFYSKQGSTVYCELCPNECIIRPDKAGDCKSKINKDGKLYSIAYGNPCAVNIDPIEKKPLFHFYPETKSFSIASAGCNFTCLNCQNWTISQSSPYDTKNYDLMPSKVVEACQQYNCESIAYTYSEPITFYEYMLDTAKIAKKKNIKNLMVSNGYIKEKPLRKLCKYIDAANIDLKGFDNDILKKLTGGTKEPVLNTLKILKEENVWLEITNLIVPSWTDDLEMIKKMCRWLADNKFTDYPLHFSRFTPMYKLTHLPPTPVSTLEKAYKIACDYGMKYVYLGNVPGSNKENTYCPKCNKIVIERKGFYILQNNIVKGKCKFCGEKIAGVFPD